MASKRRAGFRTPELRGTLGTLLRTTTGVVRDALERGARQGRARFDDARAHRRRHDALAELGELVLALIRHGEIDLAELPEARDLVHQLDELDRDEAAADGPEVEPPKTRHRFDDRTADGTVSSGAAPRPAATSTARRANRPTQNIWRPVESAPALEAPSPIHSRRTALPRDPHRKGGINFDDGDLADYMHPDDIPPKPPGGSDSDP